jgi:transcription elongation factor GreA
MVAALSLAHAPAMNEPNAARPPARGAVRRGELNPAAVNASKLMTAAEYAACRAELARLRDRRERDLHDRIRAARAFVASDAAEEIAQIQDDHAFLDAHIARLERLLDDAQVIDGPDADDQVALGRTVDVEYVRTGEVVRLRVAGVGMSDDGTRTVTAASPVGRALMGHGAGAVVSAEMPNGTVQHLRILSVAAADPKQAA